jgi:hypothetical protein
MSTKIKSRGQEKTRDLNSNKKSFNKENPGSRFIAEFYQTFKKE